MTKQSFLPSLLIIVFSIFMLQTDAQNIGINGTGNTPDATAMLDIASTNKGLLIPRVALTSTASNAPIGASVATSLLVYNTVSVSDVTPGYYYWNGSAWARLLDGQTSDWSLTGNAGTTAGTNFIGTTDAIDFVVKTNNTERIRVLSGGNVGIGYNNPIVKLQINGAVAASTNLVTAYTVMGEGGLELFRSIGAENGYIDFRNLAADDYDIRLRYNSTVGTNGAFQIATTTNGLPTSDVTRLNILNSNGNVGIGTTTPTQKLHVAGTVGLDNANAIYFRDAANTTWIRGLLGWSDDDIYIGSGANPLSTNIKLDVGGTGNTALYIDGTTGFIGIGVGVTVPTQNLSVNGTAGKTGGGTWATFSDSRLKKNITNYTEGIELLQQINTVSFQYNSKYTEEFGANKEVENGKVYYGVVAQELQQVSPDMVEEVKLPNGNKYLEVDLSKLNITLINTVVSQQKEIDELKTQMVKIMELLNKSE